MFVTLRSWRKTLLLWWVSHGRREHAGKSWQFCFLQTLTALRTGVRGQRRRCHNALLVVWEWHLLWEPWSLSSPADLDQPCLSDFAKCFLWHCLDVFTSTLQAWWEGRYFDGWLCIWEIRGSVPSFLSHTVCFFDLSCNIRLPPSTKATFRLASLPVPGASRELGSGFLRFKGITVSTICPWHGACSIASWEQGIDHAGLWQPGAPYAPCRGSLAVSRPFYLGLVQWVRWESGPRFLSEKYQHVYRPVSYNWKWAYFLALLPQLTERCLCLLVPSGFLLVWAPHGCLADDKWRWP